MHPRSQHNIFQYKMLFYTKYILLKSKKMNLKKDTIRLILTSNLTSKMWWNKKLVSLSWKYVKCWNFLNNFCHLKNLPKVNYLMAGAKNPSSKINFQISKLDLVCQFVVLGVMTTFGNSVPAKYCTTWVSIVHIMCWEPCQVNT